jgi:hypothetical protein
MQSKGKRAMDTAERTHVARVRAMDCACCETAGPSEAHEIEQGAWFLSIPLCPTCHRGNGGLHGTKVHLRVRKVTELSMLNDTIRRLVA